MQPNLAKAIISVMNKVKGIDKTMTVGEGKNAYKGVSDQIVKQILGEAMVENGLCIIPISIEAKTQVDRWPETTQYGDKQKQSVFTEAITKYLLMHESGESVEISGYGHGVDSQDKGAGKATTYALKYALLYTFLVPTGKIDDADNTQSDSYDAPKAKQQITAAAFDKAIVRIKAGETELVAKIKSTYALTTDQLSALPAVRDSKGEVIK